MPYLLMRALVVHILLPCGRSDVVTKDQLARIGAVLSMLVTATWFLWPDKDWKVDPKPLLAFLSAFGTWISCEIWAFSIEKERNYSGHPHDIELLKKITDFHPECHIRFLHEEDLGGSLDKDNIDRIMIVSGEWHGVNWEFVDTDVQHEFQKYTTATRQLSLEIARRSDRTSGGRVIIVPKSEFVLDSHSPETQKDVEAMNNLASHVAGHYDIFLRLAKRRVPGAFC